MPINDFLPFAIGGGANVRSQASYVADPTTAEGFATGVALSADCNKVWRQSSFVSAAVAAFMMNVLGIDISDDGDLAEFTTNLTDAIMQCVRGGDYGADTGAVNALVVTLSPAPTALVVGQPVLTKVGNTSTGAATLNLNGLGAAPITYNGAALGAGALVAGRLYLMFYDGAAFEMVSAPSGGSASLPTFFAQHQLASGSYDATAIMSATPTQRALNTSVVNTIAGASLSGNQVLGLPDGIYNCTATTPIAGGGLVTAWKSWVRNATTGAYLLISPNGGVNSGANTFATLTFSGQFSLSGSPPVDIFTYATQNATGGDPVGAPVIDEIYSSILLQKVG